MVKPYIDDSLFQQQYPARSLLDAGAVVAGASDWPISSANPFEAEFFPLVHGNPSYVEFFRNYYRDVKEAWR